MSRLLLPPRQQRWYALQLMLLLLTMLAAIGAADAAGSSSPSSAPMTRLQALKTLVDASPARRAVAIERLAEIGTMADAEALALRLPV